MKKGVLWLACMLGLIVLFAPRPARAEFCPARIAQVMQVDGTRDTFAVRLTAASPRNVTGQFLIETGAGWFRAPFHPLRLSKGSTGVASPPLYVALPKSAMLLNVWLAQAASDDPHWASHGMVACAPEPERRTGSGSIAQPASAAAIAAVPVPAAVTYHCARPFEQAKFQGDLMDAIPYDPGQYATALVDVDANGKVVGVTAVDASNGDFTLRKAIEDRVMHMRVTPAVAYCRAVPSTYLLRESVSP